MEFQKIMTVKEKAKELVDNMLEKERGAHIYKERNILSWSAQQCALIAVNEIRRSHFELINYFRESRDYIKFDNYWNDVKSEIEKL